MKTIKFSCPACGQHIEIEVPASGKKPLKTTLEIAVLVILICAIVAVVIMKARSRAAAEAADAQAERAFLKDINPESFEDAFATRERWRAELEQSMMQQSSNRVGFTRVVSKYVDTHDSENPTNWTGSLDMDYLNQQGGVERTNLLFLCFAFQHHVNAILNEGAMWHRWFDRVRSGN